MVAETKVMPIGLTSEEANERLKKYGKNILYKYARTSDLEILKNQFSFPILVLILSAVFLSTINPAQGILILSILSITIIMNFMRDKETEEKIIKNLIEFYGEVKAYRDGKIRRIKIEEVVPGDILVLEKGNLIPADGIVIKAKDCKVDERIFHTGIVEKVPEMEVEKTFKPYKSDPSSLFAGTFLVEGECTMRVEKIGESTKYFKAYGIKEIFSTDPKRNDAVARVKRASDSLIGIIYIASLIIVIQLLLDGVTLFDAIVIATAAAIAAIPETIFSIASNIYANSIERMSKFAIIRREATVDKIGRTTIVTTEIMKSLSRNQPTVRNLWIDRKYVTVTGDGWDVLGIFKGLKNYSTLDMLTEMAAASTDASLEYKDNTSYIDGDIIEGALVVMAMKNRMPVHNIRGEWVTLDKKEEDGVAITKIKKRNRIAFVMFGPVEKVVERCKSLYSNNKFLKIDEKIKNEIEMHKIKMYANGQEVYAMAFAWKRQEPKYFTLISLIGIYDPPKPEVKKAVQELKEAGIKPIIITTAKSGEAVNFAREVGIMDEKSKAIICDELKYLRPEERTKRILETVVFSESTNEYEAMILDVLKKEHQITYIESLGTDYSPFLYTNVSLAIENAPDIIKDNADAIIKNDKYESVMDMIEESRDMRRSIERTFYALTASDFSIFFTIIASSLIFTGDMITAAQILLINIIADSTIALNFSKESIYEKSLAIKTSKKFPDTKEYIITLIIALVVSAYIAMLSTLPIFDGYEKAITLGALALAILTISLNSLSIRDSIIESIKHTSADNILSIAVSFLILIVIFYLPISGIVGLKPLSLIQWLYVIPLLILITLIYEIKKFLARKNRLKK